jgi:hypothetical protein
MSRLELQSGETLVAFAGVHLAVQISAAFPISIDATARFDLTDNAVIVAHSGASPASTVREKIISGRGGPGLGADWIGTGITSSTAADANRTAPNSRSLGYAENSALPLGAYTSFHGAAVDSTSVLIAYTRTGDANLDGVVNNDDVTIFGANYAPGFAKPHWALGDFDYNGFVDNDDVTLLGAFYDPTAVPIGLAPASVENIEGTAVPDPATFVLAAVALVAYGAFCRRSFRKRYVRSTQYKVRSLGCELLNFVTV